MTRIRGERGLTVLKLGSVMTPKGRGAGYYNPKRFRGFVVLQRRPVPRCNQWGHQSSVQRNTDCREPEDTSRTPDLRNYLTLRSPVTRSEGKTPWSCTDTSVSSQGYRGSRTFESCRRTRVPLGRKREIPWWHDTDCVCVCVWGLMCLLQESPESWNVFCPSW